MNQIKHKNQVETTNDFSIYSKASMCAQGYANDKFIKYFVTDLKARRSPLIHRGYYLRFKAIEWIFQNYHHQIDVIVSLGCGFDTSALRYSNMKFVEIDFPFVAMRKAQILTANKLMEPNKITNCEDSKLKIVFKTHNYWLIAGDLRNCNDLCKLLVDNEIVDRQTRIALFNECTLCYLKQDDADDLIKSFFNYFSNQLIYIGYEQIKLDKNIPFSKVMLSHFESIGSPLRTFLSPKEQIERFKNMNFQDIQVIDMFKYYNEILDSEEKQRINKLEMFDEFEEFDLLCSSYALTIARKFNQESNENKHFLSEDIQNESDKQNVKSEFIQLPNVLHRFGQASCSLNQNEILIYGGFGCEVLDDKSNSNRIHHKRLNNVVKLNFEDNKARILKCKTNKLENRMHSQLVWLNNNLLLLSGGRLSPDKISCNSFIHLISDDMFEVDQVNQQGDIPNNTYRHFITKIGKSNQLFQIGGRNNCQHNENQFYIFDIDALRWMKRDFQDRIHSLAGCDINNNVVLCHGGLTSDNKFFKEDIILFDQRQEKLVNYQVESLECLYSHRIILIDEFKVLIVGGITKYGSHNCGDLIDLRNKKIVQTFDFDPTQHTLLLHNFSCHYQSENNILNVLCGGGNCFSFGTHFNQVLGKYFLSF